MTRLLLIAALLVSIAPSIARAQAPDVDPHGAVDPHAGVPGVDPHGADPHAGMPGVDPHGADPHAGMPGDPHGAGMPGGDPHGAAGGPAAGPHGGRDIESLFHPPNVVQVAPSDDVPAGTVRVEVANVLGQPVEGAAVELGTMSGGRAAERQAATTDAAGVATYEGLVAGSGTAYRVYVNYDGARYASNPFVLPPDQGYQVRVYRLEVSHDDRQLLQFVAQTIVEIRDDRLHCVVQAQMVNVGDDTTYVFPEGGTRMRLPEGFIAFNAPAALNEIEITEVADHVAFRGSLPPGLVTIAFSFDVPYSSGLGLDSLGIGNPPEATLLMGNPFRTMRYRIITDAPQGLVLDAEGFPRAQRFENEGHSLLGSELMRRPGDPPLEEVRFTLRGLPGPGPTRWIAVALGLLVLAFGMRRAFGRHDDDRDRGIMLEALSRREQELIELAESLRAERDAGEIGPETCQSQLDVVVQELATVLAKKDRLRSRGAGRPAPAVSVAEDVAPKNKKRRGETGAERPVKSKSAKARPEAKESKSDASRDRDA
jgi:hypothetical protein